jgi:hypothetical protein
MNTWSPPSFSRVLDVSDAGEQQFRTFSLSIESTVDVIEVMRCRIALVSPPEVEAALELTEEGE